MASAISGDRRGADLVGAPSDVVASKHSRVLHIRLNLPEN
jgi:hypothetical protein